MEDIDIEDLDKNFATSIFAIERELGVFIDENYPLMKYFIQVEEMNKMIEEKEKQQNKGKTNVLG